jgi:hypothetical protein
VQESTPVEVRVEPETEQRLTGVLKVTRQEMTLGPNPDA